MTTRLRKTQLCLVFGLTFLLGGTAKAQLPITCNWVGQIYRENLGSGQYTTAAPFWGDPSGWSLAGANAAGTCLGGFPDNNSAVNYSVVIQNASAPVIGANMGKLPAVIAVNPAGTADINPTLTSLSVTNSHLSLGGPTVGTLTTGSLNVDSSELLGGTYTVQNSNPSAPINTFNNATVESSNLVFQGSGAAAVFTGSLGLDQYSTHVGKSGTGTIVYGALSSLTGSSTVPILFEGVTISAGTLSHPTATIVETGGGMLFFSTNTVNGAELLGNFQIAANSNTAFNGTQLEGTTTVGLLGTLHFNTANIIFGGINISPFGSLYTSGTVNNQASGTINNAAYFENDGPLNNDGAINNLSNGTLYTYGALNNNSAGTVTNSGDFQSHAELNNSGRFNNNLDAILDNYNKITNNSVATFTNTGTLTNQASSAFENYGSLRNFGLFNSVSGARLYNYGSISNSGTFLIAKGVGLTNYTSSGAGTYMQSAGSTVVDGLFTSSTTIQINGGILQGSGTIKGNVAMDGTLSPGDSPGRLTIIGNYTQSPSGTFFAELAGLAPGTQYDQLMVQGTANLSGTLDVVTLGYFHVQVGDSFQLMRFTNETGQFTNYDLPSLLPGEKWLWAYDAHDFTISVASSVSSTPEPASFLLLGSGLLGMAGMLRRKLAA